MGGGYWLMVGWGHVGLVEEEEVNRKFESASPFSITNVV
jgi:hypothetical protein